MSSRIAPVDPASTNGQSKELLERARTNFGTIPNLLKTMAHSPAVLDGFLSLRGALGKGELSTSTREQIALAVSESNESEYCLAAHSLTAKIAGLKPEQVVAARRGFADDPHTQAVLRLTQHVVERTGKVSDEQLQKARAAGMTDAEIVEVVGNVAVMVLTNYLNNVAQTVVDFPKVAAVA